MLWDWALELHRPQCLCPSASSKVSHRFSMDLSDLGINENGLALSQDNYPSQVKCSYFLKPTNQQTKRTFPMNPNCTLRTHTNAICKQNEGALHCALSVWNDGGGVTTLGLCVCLYGDCQAMVFECKRECNIHILWERPPITKIYINFHHIPTASPSLFFINIFIIFYKINKNTQYMYKYLQNTYSAVSLSQDRS